MRLSHFFAIVICVVDGQKPFYRFAATGAFRAVVIECLFAKFGGHFLMAYRNSRSVFRISVIPASLAALVIALALFAICGLVGLVITIIPFE